MINQKTERSFRIGYLARESMLDIAKERIYEENIEKKTFKQLCGALTDDIKSSGDEELMQNAMDDIYDILDQYSEEEKWKNELKKYCASHRDINKALSVSKNNDSQEFIIIMDDSTSDSVLDYNEFGYQLREKYPDSIDDFMVLDVDTSKGITDSYDQIDYLYERK